LDHSEFTLRVLVAIEGRGEASHLADDAFNLVRDEIARYPILTEEGRGLFLAFQNAYLKDEAAVACLAQLKEKMTSVSICYFAISVVLTV
jgi:hypothetical protein